METIISYDLRLKEGVGPINLGMSRQEVIAVLGEPGLSCENNLYTTDYYTSIRLHIDYESDTEICRGIEVLNGAELMFRGKDILGLLWDDMFNWMLENDPYLDIRDDVYISHKLGISTGPEYNEALEDEVMETIVVFSDGYWPSEEEMRAARQKRIEAMPSLEEFAKQNGLEKYLQFLEPES
jgi:hypothetical protein